MTELRPQPPGTTIQQACAYDDAILKDLQITSKVCSTVPQNLVVNSLSRMHGNCPSVLALMVHVELSCVQDSTTSNACTDRPCKLVMHIGCSFSKSDTRQSTLNPMLAQLQDNL